MKISIIGAGNVGSTTAMRLAQEGVGDILIVDILKGLAHGKALDLEDARPILKQNYNITGSDDITQIKDSDIVVMTAGLARKPGMTREELLAKNAQIIKDVSINIKNLAKEAILIVVTNPLDLMTFFALKQTGFKNNKVFGMGIGLDSARFANLIALELKVPQTSVEACVIGSHGEAMLPLARFTKINGIALDEFVDKAKLETLINRTIGRGLEIVSNLGSGSAYYAPSAAIADIVKTIVKNEKRTIGVCASLNGEYGIKDVCLGVPCRIGKDGIEKVIELDLNKEEKDKFIASAESIRKLTAQLPL
ncbi:MAG: malate dehydrogenase [Candidatus Omnitrophica bacterium]|nr:malate dehydrogenase [Candidatus Omnitrophota bacterium]